MTVRASRIIEEGEDITHTYVDPLDPVLIRYTDRTHRKEKFKQENKRNFFLSRAI